MPLPHLAFARGPEAPAAADTLAEPSDAELISRVRAGDVGSYGLLFARHRDAASRLARSLTQPADADDVVADAFAKVLTALQDGKGPDEAFRPYLLTAVRTCHIDRRRFLARVSPTDEEAVLDQHTAFIDPAVAGFEAGAAAEAFRSLPERWQLVLWHLDVEGQKPAAIAPLLGMAPNAVSALAYRAREGLRAAFLQQHAAEAAREECRRTHDLLGAAVRGNLSRRDRKRVEAHLEQCLDCTALYLELSEVNTSLRALLAPIVLGGAAAAYLSSTTGTGAGLGALTALLGRARESISSPAQAALATGAAAAAAAAAVTGMVVLHTDAGSSGRVPQAGASAPVRTSGHATGSRPGHGTGATGHRAGHPPHHRSGGQVPAPGVGTGAVPAVEQASASGGASASGPLTSAAARSGHGSGTAQPSAPGSAAGSHAGSGGGRGPSGSPPASPPRSTPPSSTVGVSATLAPGHAPAAALSLGGVPAAHVVSVDLDLAGHPIALTLP